MMKRIALPTVLITSLCLSTWAYRWRSPSLNTDSTINIHDAIHTSKKRLTKAITSLGTQFDVFYVKNSPPDCINPYFPSIHISTHHEHNAWIHIVYTDAQNPALKKFVDTVDPKVYPHIYPYYTREQDFYDAPLWEYTLFFKPLSFWRGHAWAVYIDDKKKTIIPVGGIGWGFRLSRWHLRPSMITPFPLTKNMWKQDWELCKRKLGEPTEEE